LATLFAFLPAARRTQHAALIETKTPAPLSPSWRWSMPAPQSLPPETPAQPVSTVVTVEAPAPPPTPVDEDIPPPPPSGAVLGPVARTQPALTMSAPTLEMAEAAYFRGEYDDAAALYESLLRASETPNPRLHQDLAWCYQQLGNSGKATQHLGEAVRGYQRVLMDEPHNAAAQHGIAACQAALRSLRASRENAALP